jgi:hypothetical protein
VREVNSGTGEWYLWRVDRGFDPFLNIKDVGWWYLGLRGWAKVFILGFRY